MRRLEIARYDDEEQVYLLYFDSAGTELTDTVHDGVDQALKQAEFEFGLSPDDWEFSPPRID